MAVDKGTAFSINSGSKKKDKFNLLILIFIELKIEKALKPLFIDVSEDSVIKL